MKFQALKTLGACALAAMLAACGGGADMDMAGSGTKLAPTVWTSDGRGTNSCSYDPRCSNNPYAPFNVHSGTYANVGFPADGATISGMVRLQVSGLALENVELVPASGYVPRYGVFQLSNDKTHAWLDLDTTKLPNGPIAVRAAAFNKPAGQPDAVELTAMSPRTWMVSNTNPPVQALSVTAASAPGDGAVVAGTIRLELRGTGIANAELLPGVGYTPRLGQFNVSADRTYAWLDLDTRTIPDGVRDIRVSVFNVTQGQAGAQEVVAISPRRWDFRNGVGADFHGSVTVAPLHGSTLSGIVVLEVRGAGLRNIELLPAQGYTPILGTFSVWSPQYAIGYYNFDTRNLPNGPIDLRISAFSVAPGQPGAREIIAMPTRQWIIRN
ncbi:hypothetical protein [Noviherbaspirillum aerium]|uniref:hypothetical protein n=1 Tax=Noviherbaspirillum aerium TaxID=2588497 RepID=UPI00124D63D2|nr:hypothetical protein [Noviherbaspirillum aerium]